jgi:hypothetical protein
MDLGAYQLQIFLSLFVVLGAAFVALVCDLLHGNNEQLRVLNTELKVRREEEQKRFDILLADKAEAKRQETVAESVEPAAVVELRAERGGRPQRTERKRSPAPEALAAMERGEQMATRPPQKEETISTIPAVVVKQEVEHVVEVERLVAQAMENTFAKGVELPAPAPPPQAVPAQAAPTGMSRDWSSLLKSRTSPVTAVRPNRGVQAPTQGDLLAAVVAATDSTTPAPPAPSPLPAGFQDGYVLSRLVEGRQPISGLVVSIGVVGPSDDAGPESVPGAVRTLLESLMGPEDFATQSAKEEYLLIYPGLRGASAERQLAEVRQRLQDFQARTQGQFSAQVNWGGSEEGIASAIERMNESRRLRKVVSMETDGRTALPKAG